MERNDELLTVINDQAEEIRRLKEAQNDLVQLQTELIGLQKDLVHRMRQIVARLPVALVVVDQNQRIEAASRLAETYFQFSSVELAGQPITVVFPEVESFEITSEAMRVRGRRKSGETFVAEIFVSNLGAGHLFISVQDITERHRLEQLRRDLMNMVSHDLRSPLAAVRVVLDMIKEGIYGALTVRGHEVAENAISATEYLSSLVQNLLEAEKAEQGTIELDLARTTVGAIIKKAVSVVKAPNESMSIETEYTNDELTADQDRVVQVLINLISNAIKYSPDNSKVRVVAGMDGLNVKFQVIDQGPGVPKEMQTLIFERYRQLEQPKGVKRQGFGLGLSICKALVERHHGHIWVESAESEGSKFCFTIPISPVQSSAQTFF